MSVANPSGNGSGSPLHQHDPDPLDGRGAGRRVGASGDAGRPWRRWRTRSGRSSSASTPADPIWPNRGPIRALGRSCVDAALFAAASDRRPFGQSEVRDPRRGRGAVGVDHQKFRQLDSKCPGHPEYRWTSGGRDDHRPPGPGGGHQRRHGDRRQLAGVALQPPRLRPVRLRRLRDRRRRLPDGGGPATKPPASPATSSCPTLCWIFDNNRITIEGSTALAVSDDVAARFIALGWNVTRVEDANDLAMLARAFRSFREETGRPTLIIVDSHIGYGTSKQDSHKAHGEPLGPEVIRRLQGAIRPLARTVLRPRRRLRSLQRGDRPPGQGAPRGVDVEVRGSIRRSSPNSPSRWSGCSAENSPKAGTRDLPSFPADEKGQAGRAASSVVLNAVAKNVPWLIGGSAGPDALDQDPDRSRRGRRLPGR